MEEDLVLFHAYFSLSSSITATLRTTVASLNSCLDVLTFLEEEGEEFEEIVADVMESLQNPLLTLPLQQGTQLPPPRQNIFLFPDFVASNFPGRDLYTELLTRPWLFYNMTGETPQSLQAVVQDLGPVISNMNMDGQPRQRASRCKLTMHNRILLVFIWLWRYQTSSELSALFLISPTVIERNIQLIIPILCQYFQHFLQWPSNEEWLQRFGYWENFPAAVAVIDGTLHEIYRPITDTQELFYSGRVKYHCFSSQLVVDNQGNIVFARCGFLGRCNDAGQWQHIVPQIGQGTPNPLPPNAYILADKGYPNEDPLLTPWRRQRLDGHPDRQLFNQELGRLRESVEHSIKRFKEYKIVSNLWRHERALAVRVMELCASLAQRHIVLTRVIR